ncbi:MAG: HEAT repeat domain-containing protein [Elusimicrobiota bacterium]
MSFYTLEITERCNLDCAFCLAAPRYRKAEARVAPYAEVREQLKSIRKDGYEGVCFTGGEPTTHPELLRMVRAARRLKLGVAVNTNGLRFAEPGYLKAFLPAKFSCILSFHSHREDVYERITRKNAFSAAVQAIRSLLSAGVPVFLSHVLSRQNHSDFPEWVDYVNARFEPLSSQGRLTACVFFNQHVDGPDRCMIEFKEARPFLLEGLKRACFPIERRTSCTASDCLLEEGFLERKEHFQEGLRAGNIERLKELPLHLQKDLLNYFIPDACYSCERFLNPVCRGIRKKYALRFGAGEYPGLLNARERETLDSLGRDGDETLLPSSPHIALSGQALPALSSALTESFDPQLRREAARALGGSGDSSEGGVRALLKALHDPDRQTRRDAALALYRLAAPAAGLAEALEDKDVEVRRIVCLALVKAPGSGDSLPFLIEALSDPDAQVRRTAALALSTAPEAAGPLARTLKDEDLEARRNAAAGLAALERVPEKFAGALARALDDPDAEVRKCAAGALFKMQSIPPSAGTPLLAAFSSEDPVARVAAGLGLSRMAAPPAKAAPRLLERLEDSEAQVRRFAVMLLSQLTPLPKTAVPALAKALRDTDGQTRRNAAQVLARLEPPPLDAAGALTRALSDPLESVRREAANALSRMDPPPAPAGEALIRLLGDEDPMIRMYAALGLSRMSPPPAEAVPALKAAAGGPDAALSRLAAEALSKLEPPAPPPEPSGDPAEELSSPDEQTRRRAEGRLFSLPEVPADAGEPLIAALASPDAQTRAAASLFLSRMAAVPREALEPLLSCAKDPEPRVRRNALLAVAAIDPLPRAGAEALLCACKDKDALARTIATDAVKRLIADKLRSEDRPG